MHVTVHQPKANHDNRQWPSVSRVRRVAVLPNRIETFDAHRRLEFLEPPRSLAEALESSVGCRRTSTAHRSHQKWFALGEPRISIAGVRQSPSSSHGTMPELTNRLLCDATPALRDRAPSPDMGDGATIAVRARGRKQPPPWRRPCYGAGTALGARSHGSFNRVGLQRNT